MGSFFFFFFSHTPVLCSLSGAGGCEDELPPGRGLGCDFSAAAGTGVVFPVPTPERRGLAPGSALTTLWGWWCLELGV